MSIRQWSALALVLALLLGCDGSLARAKSGLRIGYAVEAPYAFVSREGRVTGESPEIARLVAAKLGLGPLDWRQMGFAQLFDELKAGKIDLVAAGTFVTAERRAVVAFSQPTFRVTEALLVRAGNPAKLRSFLPQTGVVHRFAVLDGAEEVRWMGNLGWPATALVPVPDPLTALAALGTGQADALVLSAPTLRNLAAADPTETWEVITPDEPLVNPAQWGAFAFRREDRALREAWDSVLVTFVGTPAHEALVRPFGFTKAEIP